jgi:hypothetical protein
MFWPAFFDTGDRLLTGGVERGIFDETMKLLSNCYSTVGNPLKFHILKETIQNFYGSIDTSG